ncbi:MAG: hypothetical protein RL291_1587 [Pseudomonadota bacterium]
MQHAPQAPRQDASTAMAGVSYLFPKAQNPGEIREVVPGLHWLRLPLPFALNHVNVWLLDGGKRGWSIIDTGANKDETIAIWEAVLRDGPLAKKKIAEIFITHGHPDHIGLAGWLVEKTGAPLMAALSEWLGPRIWREEGFKPIPPEIEAFYVNHGLSPESLAAWKAGREKGVFRNHPLPHQLVRVRDKDKIRLGAMRWEALANGGHADEHLSLHARKEKLFIAGDQILSRISPVVGVFPGQPLANPLADYLASLKRLKKLPDDVLVLPSHGLPFHGLHTRIDELEAHHQKRLGQLLDGMTGAQTSVELAHVLFEKAMAEGQTILALAETLAHIHYLVGTSKVVRKTAKSGRITFSKR